MTSSEERPDRPKKGWLRRLWASIHILSAPALSSAAITIAFPLPGRTLDFWIIDEFYTWGFILLCALVISAIATFLGRSILSTAMSMYAAQVLILIPAYAYHFLIGGNIPAGGEWWSFVILVPFYLAFTYSPFCFVGAFAGQVLREWWRKEEGW